MEQICQIIILIYNKMKPYTKYLIFYSGLQIIGFYALNTLIEYDKKKQNNK